MKSWRHGPVGTHASDVTKAQALGHIAADVQHLDLDKLGQQSQRVVAWEEAA